MARSIKNEVTDSRKLGFKVNYYQNFSEVTCKILYF